MKLKDRSTTKEVLDFLSRSSLYGNLGLFIGAGLSKAILNSGWTEMALSWGQLVEAAAKELKVDYDSISKQGVGYPDISSRVCKEYAKLASINYDQACVMFKNTIAILTNWYPSKEQGEEFAGYLSNIDPSWIITTNFDLVLECLLTGKSLSLGPYDQLSTPKGIIPIYHLHGVRNRPESIVITQEDYVTLFRPNEYRQVKLALTIKESVTLILGYGLGDVNVLTAVDWSKNVFKRDTDSYPHDMVQIIREESPKAEPYRDNTGIMIVETKEIKDFLAEFAKNLEVNRKTFEEQRLRLKELAFELNNPGTDMIDKFIDNADFRTAILDTLSQAEVYLISEFLEFLSKCLDTTWKRSQPSGAFEAYAENLRIILDILLKFDVYKMPPALFESVAYAFQRVGYYIGRSRGQSYAAADLWDEKKKQLSKDTIKELYEYAVKMQYYYIYHLFQEGGLL